MNVDGVRGLWCVPVEAPTDRAEVCIHGGGFVGDSVDSHPKPTGYLAKATGVRAFSAQYRLVPKHPSRHRSKMLSRHTGGFGHKASQAFD
ncbi:alpha/beta hydrolase fold domain-containing protein [Nocardia sp. NPDC005745]|uniref:alpha/beta hydrolase n=1 Tax=Nocardia sp. NPDC005745 TaxID=3157061 RepID=UPI0033EE84F3